jgi:HK97 family phage major capsid protein
MRFTHCRQRTQLIPPLRSGTRERRATYAKLKDSQGNPLRIPEMVARVPTLSTTAAPITETQGSSSNCSSMIFGDFTKMFIGLREDVRVFVLTELYAATGQLALVVHARADVALAHNASFCRMLGIKP